MRVIRDAELRDMPDSHPCRTFSKDGALYSGHAKQRVLMQKQESIFNELMDKGQEFTG